MRSKICLLLVGMMLAFTAGLGAQVAVGTAAPDISFLNTWNNPDGHTSLHDLQGSWVLLYYWDDG